MARNAMWFTRGAISGVALLVFIVPASADGLDALAGRWATSGENCTKWKTGAFKTTAEKSGNVLEVTGNTLNWTRGSCVLTNIKSANSKTTANGACEQRGDASDTPVTITHTAKNRIAVDTAGRGYYGNYVRCQ
jgi:hypothetical protein